MSIHHKSESSIDRLIQFVAGAFIVGVIAFMCLMAWNAAISDGHWLFRITCLLIALVSTYLTGLTSAYVFYAGTRFVRRIQQI